MLSTTSAHVLLSRGASVAARGKSWPAYGLAVLVPGAGHAYAGHWRRGLAWALLCGGALAFLSTGVLLLERAALEPLVVTALRLEVVTFADVGLPLAVLVLSVLDLYGLSVLEEDAVGPTLPGRS
ncbi:DUF6677 family protein [Natronococcus wangiae]|uniref:DUF6677 family protein n=1 Tax=Natronococcus wangiae TaxID=3068275 RepID=UPI00273E9D55|nr:hypothetical protein [Natronococcus sp. AD5]